MAQANVYPNNYSFEINDLLKITVESKHPTMGKSLIIFLKDMLADRPEKIRMIELMAAMEEVSVGADVPEKAPKKTTKKKSK